MPAVTLNALVTAKLARPKITPDDAREVLRVIEKDGKYSAAEIKQLKRLTALPRTRFERKDEFIPNPFDPSDGVTVKADPRKWLDGTLELATAKLQVRSTIPELSLKLSQPKDVELDDLDLSVRVRELAASVTGTTASRAGTIAFSYGSRSVSVPVKAGQSLEKVMTSLFSAINKAEGASVWFEGWVDPNKRAKQTVTFYVL